MIEHRRYALSEDDLFGTWGCQREESYSSPNVKSQMREQESSLTQD